MPSMTKIRPQSVKVIQSLVSVITCYSLAEEDQKMIHILSKKIFLYIVYLETGRVANAGTMTFTIGAGTTTTTRAWKVGL